MASVSEILILILIIICLLILPRFFKSGRAPSSGPMKKWNLSASLRFFIVISIFLPAVTLFVVRPWAQNFHLFVLIGVVPVLLFWSIYWILQGFKKRR